jgi:hypothetical protein
MAYGVFYAEMARDLGPWARDGLSTGGPVFFIFLDKRHWKFFPIFDFRAALRNRDELAWPIRLQHHRREYRWCFTHHQGRFVCGLARLMAGPSNDPVQVFRTDRDLHWEFLRLWTGFELSSSWRRLPCYGADLNRNILDFMRWPHIGLGAQDLNGFNGQNHFPKK